MTAEEEKLLIKMPALISALAASSRHKINEEQKAHAIKLVHLHAFTSDNDLDTYYSKVEKHFIENFENIEKEYTPFDEPKRESIKKEIEKGNKIIASLESPLSEKLQKSLDVYSEHVKNAEHSFLEHLILPVPIKGLRE